MCPPARGRRLPRGPRRADHLDDMDIYQLWRPDGSPSGAWACGACHRVHAQSFGRLPNSDDNRHRAERCCAPQSCRYCGKATAPDVLGDSSTYHLECLPAPDPPHPSLANPWARLLYRRMSDISEDGWAAGWLLGNEFALWDAVHGGRRSYGQHVLSDEEIEELRVLSEAAQGWILTGHADEHAPQLVSFERWSAVLAGRTGAM
jgi:hypothetical protein